jgi:hypothetical protein
MPTLADLLFGARDATRSFTSGAIAGVGQDVLGIPGDLRQGFRNTVNPLFDQLDKLVGYQAPPPVQPRYNILPTSEQIAQYLPQYTPQTSAGQTAQTIGRLAPPVALGLGAGNATAFRSLGTTAKEFDDLLKLTLSSDPMAWWPLAASTIGWAAANKQKP